MLPGEAYGAGLMLAVALTLAFGCGALLAWGWLNRSALRELQAELEAERHEHSAAVAAEPAPLPPATGAAADRAIAQALEEADRAIAGAR